MPFRFIYLNGKLFSFHFRKALAAVNRAIFAGFKGDSCLFAAGSADCGIHFSCRFCSSAVFTSLTALSASLGLILEAFLSVEFLFTGSENKFLAAVFAD